MELGGLQNVLEEPEFLEPGPLKQLIRFIGSPVTIRQSLGRLDREAGEGLGVWIGALIADLDISTANIVAMLGAIIPAPLAIPPTDHPAGSWTTAVLGTESVVMIATAAASQFAPSRPPSSPGTA